MLAPVMDNPGLGVDGAAELHSERHLACGEPLSERGLHDFSGRGGEGADDSARGHVGKVTRPVADDLAIAVNEHRCELVWLQLDTDGVAVVPNGRGLPAR